MWDKIKSYFQKKGHLKDITIKTIHHQSQKYETAGNYGDGRKIWFEISEMEDWRYEALVIIHELVEYFLVKHRGIKIEDIDEFDTKTVFEVDPKNQNDPGASKLAPYHKEHMFATKIEKIICKELGVDWKTYDGSFSKLEYK